MKRHEFTKLIAAVFSLALIASACGGSDSEGGSGGGGDQTTTTAGDTDGGGTSLPGDTNTEVEVNENERAYGGTVTIGQEAESNGLRPFEDSCSTNCYNILFALYDPLMSTNADGDLEGYLAESVTGNEDFTQFVLTLRDGIEFHDGSPLTAQTIADMFPVQQAGTAGASAISAAGLESVEATGELEVTYTLNKSNSAFPSVLARSGLGLVFEPTSAAADPVEFNNNPIGTGPFVFVSRDVDNETVVERNPNYWLSDADGNQLPFLDRIEFRPIPDEGTRLDSLVSGTTNAFMTLRQGTIRDARTFSDQITLYEHQGNSTGGGWFNVMNPPLDDVRVRQALNLMGSQDHVIIALGGEGISLPTTQWFSPDSPFWSQRAADSYASFDFPAGQALMQEYVDDPERSDGLAPGTPISIELTCPPDPTLVAAMQVLEQAWTGSGLVEVEMTSFDQQTHISNAVAGDKGLIGDHSAGCWRWSSEEDPSVSLNPFLGPPTAEIAAAEGLDDVPPSPGNVTNWFNREAFDLAQQAMMTDVFQERKDLYEQINIIINTEAPVWYSGSTATAIGADPSIQGFNSWTLPSGSLGNGHPGAEIRWHEVFVVE